MSSSCPFRVAIRFLPLLLMGALPGLAGVPAPERLSAGLSPVDAAALRLEVRSLGRRLAALEARPAAPARLADAEVFLKGALWALRFEDRLDPADLQLLQRSLRRGRERAEALERGQVPWSEKRGWLVRGYRSAVDGSVQPYGLQVPRGYQPGKPMRLDVVLHGSTRPTGLSELRFLSPFDAGDSGGTAPDEPFIELRPLGRVENCYRWAGETDVFEAIEDVCREYTIDRRRIVLRGMSMGASGTWHLGLKHPDRFAALGPYCGYVDTHQFSRTPLPNFIPVGRLPPHQEAGLHMLDSVDYAANAGVVPVIAAMGEKDVFFQAHVLMDQAMAREGLKLLNLISPGTGHVQDPVTFAEQMRRIGEPAARGVDPRPEHLRFVTWTLKYSRCHWLEALGLEEHYQRSELEARRAADGAVELREPRNITRFAVYPEAWGSERPRLRVGGNPVRLPREPSGAVVIQRRGRTWVYAGSRETEKLPGKSPGLQGPIDDAFTQPFLCVRGTGKPWNPAVQAWSEANLKRFAYEWSRYLRGDLPVKDDTEVTPEDLRRFNLVLFGDPGSNPWILQALPRLPLRWTAKELRLGDRRYPAGEHVPALIYPNPLPGADGRYLVLNSGHTFHEKELGSLNYLLFPRLGDWAVLRVGARKPDNPSEPLEEEVLQAGFFDEQWRFRASQSVAPR